MKSILSALIGTTLACAALQAQSAEPVVPAMQKIQVDIVRPSLNEALQAWAEQTGYQLLCLAPEVARELAAPKVRGEYTAKGALDELLAGTPLMYEFTRERMVTVRTRFVPASQTTGARERVEVPRMQLAQLGAQGERSGSAGEAPSGRRETGGRPEREEGDVEDVEEIVVTGTHIRGLRRTAVPVQSIDREELERTGFSSLQEVFRSLPQNLSELSDEGGLAVGTSRTASSNAQSAHSVSLRGLGPEATLVLVNGKRRAGNVNGRVVDLAAIPLSLIDHVDVATGGSSAVYGSDAVAGVVNLVLRDRFDGLETQAYYGEGEAGAARSQISAVAGLQAARGGVVIAGDYSEQDHLDAADTRIMRLPSPTGLTPRAGAFDLIPHALRRSAYVSGHLDIGDAFEVYGNALYSSNVTRQTLAFSVPNLTQRSNTESDQYSAVAGARWAVSDEWRIDVSATTSEVKNTEQVIFVPAPAGGSDTLAAISSVAVVADGPLVGFAGRDIKFALGAEARNEEYRRERIPTGLTAEDDDRTVKSLFAEVVVPLVQTQGSALDLSVAGRYDDYSDFGSTFNPQAGIVWRLERGIGLRAAYAEAFRAPDLFTLDFASAVTLANLPDVGSPSGSSPTLVYGGGNSNLDPETANTWSVGIDYLPPSSDRTRLSISYFNIAYEDRIDEPAPGADVQAALRRPELYGAFIERVPTAADLGTILANATTVTNFTGVPFNAATQNILSVFPNLVVIDNRFQNVGRQRVTGIDLDVLQAIDSDVGTFSFGITGTYFLDFERQNTPTAPTFSQLNTPGKPVDLRLRGRVGWARSFFQSDLYINYVDAYEDTLVSPSAKIDAWTTVDLTIQADMSRWIGATAERFSVALSATNLLDKEPPVFLRNRFGLGYDAANATAIGRFLSLRMLMRW